MFELSSIYLHEYKEIFCISFCMNDYKLYVTILFINQLKTAKNIVQML